MISIDYDVRRELSIKNITITSELGQQDLITENNPLNEGSGMFEAVLCAECMETNQIQLTVEFNEEQEPISVNYSINKMAQVEVIGEQNNNMVFLDASQSTDPEGVDLSYRWFLTDTIVADPRLTIPLDSLVQNPVLLEVTDGVTVVNDVVTYDPITGTPTFTPERLKCTAMSVVSTNKSVLNPELDLGAFPPVGTQLPLTGTKLSRSYRLGFAFEVRATIVPHTAVLDEGHDIAASYSLEASDNTKKQDWRGRRRKEPNRSDYEPGQKTAGFPNPLPAAGTHPPFVADDYDHHPTTGFSDKNTATGIQRFSIKAKGLYKDGANTKMAWYDQPGLVLRANTDVSKGLYYKAYFRAWMKPTIPPCQKYYIVEIVVDNTGKVTKNSITAR